ncbi:chemotaxis protein CheW [Pseudomonas sp. J452]|uniref:CheW domain-containing protein n=1 Tax=Pseudomonas sp. J452 TaxID=2898441 RepID=UPI0021ADA8A5|nr:CheW domain-containing protein [Pseudomonas sp. J452]UUY07204.1 chemotaxis protein CheW [Pseudomonas sp. J452]
MSRTVATATRPQQALQSYLDALLQEAAAELEQSITLDEFEAAVIEEQVRDARLTPHPVLAAAIERPLALAEARPLVLPTIELPPTVSVPVIEPVAPVVEARVEQQELQPPVEPAKFSVDGRPSWAEDSFECLLFDVAGLTLAVPLVCLGTIYPLANAELTPLFGQPDWFLGILPSQAGNLKVLDTARWVMPERYRDDFRDGLQYVISVEGYEWGLAVHQVSRSIRLVPDEIKWRSHRSQRPWLAGTVIEHMCALLDVSALAELIASGATRKQAATKRH